MSFLKEACKKAVEMSPKTMEKPCDKAMVKISLRVAMIGVDAYVSSKSEMI